ncbi:hypothetical protein QAD02_019397 [Eretmocerus hayati]|uniref:Uncharacterized protein n=1 Tax=Eretmocerus hayati TaxID=131215 RepID=A0ACC2PJ31_9HYME|nr:hypothetical protein QAD02_019397 [Eretmocerus hayati]
MQEVKEAIGLDKVDLSGKLLLIREHHKTNANFILNSIISHCKDENSMTCLLLFHNTFGHFHNIGMKLGYNLRKESTSRVKVVEALKIISKNIHQISGVQCDDPPRFDIGNNNNDLVQKLAQVVKTEFFNASKEYDSQKIYIIIDDLSHLFDMGLETEDVWLFIRHLRSLVEQEPSLVMCIATHVYEATEELCQSNVLAMSLQYFAELVVDVLPLGSGYSKDISGKMIVSWKSPIERLKFRWPEKSTHLFKLYDQKVKLFAPGSSLVM